MSQQVTMYRGYSKDVMKICSHDDVETAQTNLNEVFEDSNHVSSLFETFEERAQLMEKNSLSANKQSFILTKLNPTGLDRFIKYKSFI